MYLNFLKYKNNKNKISPYNSTFNEFFSKEYLRNMLTKVVLRFLKRKDIHLCLYAYIDIITKDVVGPCKL